MNKDRCDIQKPIFSVVLDRLPDPTSDTDMSRTQQDLSKSKGEPQSNNETS